jgi:transposase
VITLDRAGWHTTRKLHVPSTPASPELNPTENIWQYIRQSYLSNRVFRDYDDVIEASRLVHRFQSSNHIRRLDRVYKTTCGRPGFD